MGWGHSTNVTTTHLNASTDDPSQARVEIYNALVELAAVINGRNTTNGVAGLDASGKITASLLPTTITSAVGVDITLQPGSTKVNIEDILNLNPKTTAQLQAVTAQAGDIAYCSDGNAGQPCLAVSFGESDSSANTIWYRVNLGAEIATS